MTVSARIRGFITIGLLPALVLYLFFVIVPIFWSAYYGFFDWKGIGAAKFIGFDNYAEVIQDPIFWKAFKNNMLIVAASVFGQVPIAMVLALLLMRSTLFQRVIRASVFMPMVLSSVVVGIIWGYIYHPQIGILNFLLEGIGLESWKKSWLSDPKVSMFALMVPIIWNYIGPYMIMFIAALQNISPEIEDAAQLDGVGPVRKLFAVTLPMIWDTVKVAVVLCISGSLKAFDLIYVMTGGGPAHSTELLASYMYNSTFNVYRFGFGSAISTAIIILSLFLIVGSQYLMKRDYR
ncbi:raffinose/stachyose/melibiose transport system permease protein [Paenibacillus sp. V4I3]|uniref:carbohydrate ABC transporter permease n=1 Tax=unclassified Paenibacillus TaxID=185978 RepID=UPI00277D2FC3|nr:MULTISPECIES: sugar ABC transporter permease [unclassified Paenibacillus]MDQ0871482.1 raffinose/stachyose/melibiose transport system permease protein [Paenibacillus sp. V4I3]MDQ0885207.1 raffinose/stachyose/melibiose transport system permease protein [Paenibacillus sp. V4I9]